MTALVAGSNNTRENDQFFFMFCNFYYILYVLSPAYNNLQKSKIDNKQIWFSFLLLFYYLSINSTKNLPQKTTRLTNKSVSIL